MEARFAIGVDLGGTKIATGLADRHGKILARQIVPTIASEGAEAVIRRISETIHRVMADSGVRRETVVGIGICCPGPLDPETGVVFIAPNLNWRDVPICDRLAAEFGLPVNLENDANAAALAELWFGAGRDVSSLLYMTVSTGVGGGIILDGEILHGKNFTAGEIGHSIVMARDGHLCGCGQRGCLEAVSSGTAIANAVRRAAAAGRPTGVLALVNDLSDIDAKTVAEAAAKGDAVAQEALDEAFLYLGTFIVSMLNVLNIEKVVLGGGVSKLETMLPALRAIVSERMAQVPARNTPIVAAETGENVGILGAVGLMLGTQAETKRAAV